MSDFNELILVFILYGVLIFVFLSFARLKARFARFFKILTKLLFYTGIFLFWAFFPVIVEDNSIYFIVEYWLIPGIIGLFFLGRFIYYYLLSNADILNKIRLDASNYLNKPDSPEFVPNNLYPWEAEFLINQGQVNFKRLVLSYFFYLEHRKYIEIRRVGEKYTFEILKELPNKFHETIDEVLVREYKDMTRVMDSILEKETLITNHLAQNLKKYFLIFPNKQNGQIGYAITCVVVYALRPISETPLLIVFILTEFLIKIYSKVGILNESGKEMKSYALAYRYYIYKAESEKLAHQNDLEVIDFQDYLVHLPYAVAFGYLQKLDNMFN
jgi:hypothetical protein